MADLTARFTNLLEDIPGRFRVRSIGSLVAPTVDEHRALSLRRAEVAAGLASDARSAAAVVSKLLTGFPTYNADAGVIRSSIALYVEALQGIPTWAIERARLAFGSGSNRTPWAGDKCPTSAQLAAEARAHAKPFVEEEGRLAAILNAEIYTQQTDEERAEVIAGFNKLLADLKNVGPDSLDDRKLKPPVETPDQALDRIKAELKASPLKFSHPELIPGVRDQIKRGEAA